MRRVFYLLFAILYATLSSGAPSLVHYCAHDNDLHLSSPRHELEEMSCCESEPQEESTPSCHRVPESSHESQINESDDCCATSFVSLDYAKQESTYNACIHAEIVQVEKARTELNDSRATQNRAANSSKRGPPLYVLYRRLVLYD